MPPFLEDILINIEFYIDSYFLLTLKEVMSFLLIFIVSDENWAVIWIVFCLYVILHFYPRLSEAPWEVP